jgi:arginine/lysine/ornithine decarboxylase
MKTPIYDFVKRYMDLRPARFHMPGHKGRGPLGCEALDLTEIPGADSLYEASGIIAESEANASARFGCPSFYSTEGSSQCIRAMLLLAKQATGNRQQATGDEGCGLPRQCAHWRAMTQGRPRFRVLAARNVHSAFLTAAALLDLDVAWLPPADGSYLSAAVTPEALDAALAETGAGAVYLTCPDYLGKLPDLGPLAAVCHARNALLLVDNAHGAYLRFLSPSRHPMDLGADLCCDSAHKTLPVLTGGAYLHVSERLLSAGRETRPLQPGSEAFPLRGRWHPASPASRMTDEVSSPVSPREALALFGSTSPSYLILQSLDLANPYLETLPERLAVFLPRVEALKARLTAAGWRLTGDEPLKLTLHLVGTSIACPQPLPKAFPLGGRWPAGPDEGRIDADRGPGAALAAFLEEKGVFCEFADPEHLVFLLSPENPPEDLERLEQALNAFPRAASLHGRTGTEELPQPAAATALPERVCSIREAMLAPAVTVPAGESLGRVLARPGVSCPPAVPILMPGERIDAAALAAFARYGVETVRVLP